MGDWMKMCNLYMSYLLRFYTSIARDCMRFSHMFFLPHCFHSFLIQRDTRESFVWMLLFGSRLALISIVRISRTRFETTQKNEYPSKKFMWLTGSLSFQREGEREDITLHFSCIFHSPTSRYNVNHLHILALRDSKQSETWHLQAGDTGKPVLHYSQS